MAKRGRRAVGAGEVSWRDRDSTSFKTEKQKQWEAKLYRNKSVLRKQRERDIQ